MSRRDERVEELRRLVGWHEHDGFTNPQCRYCRELTALEEEARAEMRVSA